MLSDMELERALALFGVLGSVQDVKPGPTVVTYEIEPAQGTTQGQLRKLERNLDLALGITGIQVKMIPNSKLFALTVPKLEGSTITPIYDLVTSPLFTLRPHPLKVALGVQENGDPLFINLKDQPHLLIAGTTGSGKSILIHNIIYSLIRNSSNAEVQLALIDPKGTEFVGYQGLPHLFTKRQCPVTSVGDAVIVLQRLVQDMETRFALFARNMCRDLEEYNQRFPEKKMPYLVVVIDELADLVLQAKANIEHNLIRLAQKSRAAGIHLVAATQRPTREVVTGLIKANFPGRISLKVRSGLDSRIILDQGGAEKLLGKGDLLYLNGSDVVRAQAAFVTPEDVKCLRDSILAEVNMAEVTPEGKVTEPADPFTLLPSWDELPEDEGELDSLIFACKAHRSTMHATTDPRLHASAKARLEEATAKIRAMGLSPDKLT
jgi:S-DNA-T family DNA segregation ATPase FtsK/SpoIIIE